MLAAAPFAAKPSIATENDRRYRGIFGSRQFVDEARYGAALRKSLEEDRLGQYRPFVEA